MQYAGMKSSRIMNPDHAPEEYTEYFATYIDKVESVISMQEEVSGLAIGCDKAAHEGCLDAGGQTIAIVASGLNIVHPKENAPLQQRILENGGLILSEQPFGVKANPTRLVARNRLQAALSNTVILAECPQQS